MSSKLIVKTAYANIYSKPKFSSQLVTQALFSEVLDIISSNGDWFEVSQWDGYVGYTHRFYLSDNVPNQGSKFLVTDRFISLYDSSDFDNLVMLAPFGSDIPVISNDKYHMSESINNENYFFMDNTSLLENNSRNKILEHSKNLIGSPYLWGGKTPFGYDCSGFLQQVFKSINISLQRDTSEQIKDERMNSIDIESADIGDIVFFNMEGNGVDHVGIWYGESQVIHCGGEVKIQSIDDDSHKRLRDYILDVKSIGKLLDE
jgi:cell wall-associated NlpC family hydrolase